MLHDIAVVGNHVERHPVIGNPGVSRARKLATITIDLTHHRQLEVARNRSVENAETVAAGTYVQEGLVLPVGQHLVTEKTIGVEGVEPQLAGLVPGLVGDRQVDVIVAVPPPQARTAGQAQVDPVFDRLVATIHGAVVVHHRRIALVDVLRGEIEHVVVEPVGAHGFAPVATDLDAAVVAGLEARRGIVDIQGFARGAGERRAGILGAGVDAVVTGQLDRPAIVVVLAREEERVGKTVAFRGRVAVMLMGADGVQAKAPVGRRVNRQGIVMPHQHRLAIAYLKQFGREGAVECPQRIMVLDREVGVKLHLNALGCALVGRVAVGVVIEPAWREFPHGVVMPLHTITQAAVDVRAGLHRLEGVAREKLIETLVRPAFSRWPAFCGRIDPAIEEKLDLRPPGVAVQHIGELCREGRQCRLPEKGIQRSRRRAATRHLQGILRRCGAQRRNRKRNG
ncbi:hypothetical protein D3C78_772810 [compost metagenome]